ncbi:glycosyltransferase [Methylobacter sp.]|uniref:glycosyltransferase n=1 Tax=Methylobacter sp. TaxID=2051955 RepID=UPI003DA34798
MKILMVTRETQADRRYGLGRSLAPLVDEFQRRNIVIDYACQDDLGVRARAWQRKLHHLLSGLFAGLSADTDFPILIYVVLERLNMGRLAARVAAKHGHTHVHCHDPIIAAGFSFFSRFHPGLKARWGVTEHGFGCYTDAIHADGVRMGARAVHWMRRWEVRTLLAASWVVSPTRSAMEQVALGLDIASIPATWRHIYHARPALNRYSREEARRRLGWQDDVLYVLGVGRIAPVKQFPMLIEACARLKKQADIQLVILGEGDYSSLQTLGKQKGLGRDILFASTDDVGLYLCAADLYVSTSASESFGLANLEAMAAGLAVLCTAVGGVPEVVGDGALLIPPETEALTNAMRRLLDNGALRQSIAQKGQARAEAWPDIVEIANNYEKIYQ